MGSRCRVTWIGLSPPPLGEGSIGGCVLEGMICPRCAHECDRGEPNCSHCGCRLPRTGEPTDSSVEACDSAAMSGDGDPFTLPAVEALVRVARTRVIHLACGDRLVLGRTSESPVADLCGSNISWHHAEIYVNESGVFVRDTNSTNGTFIEGQRLSPSSPHQVKATTEVRLGMGDDRDPPVRLTIDVNERVGT